MDKGINALSVKEANNLSLASMGVVVETGTTALTSQNFFAITCLTDTVFATLTDGLASGDAMTGFTITAGLTIFGDFTAVTLTSGAIRG